MPPTHSARDLEEIEAIKAGVFELRAPEMRLDSGSASGRTYSGGGSLRQADDGLDFELYAPGERATLKQLEDRMQQLPGTWVDESQLATLELTDQRGRHWRANKVSVHEHFSAGGLIARGRVRQLEHAVERRSDQELESHRIWMHLPGRLRLPRVQATETRITVADRHASVEVQRDAWLVMDSGIEWLFTYSEAGVDLLIESSSPFPPGFETRVEEALWFIVAREARWSILRLNSDSTSRFVVRPMQPPSRCRLRPPLDAHREPSWIPDIEQLLLSYLHFIANEGEQGATAPTSAQLLRVIRASASNVDEEALALSLAIESLVERHFSSWAEPEQEEQEELERLRGHIRQAIVSESLKRRVIGTLGRWKGSSPHSALQRLAEAGVISDEQRRVWKKMRPMTAHGNFVAGRTVNSLRAAAEDCDQLQQLLLRLILHTIGYSGRYNDRTTPGWPVREFPDANGADAAG